MTERRIIQPASFGTPSTRYSPAVLVGQPTAILFLAGQTPTNVEGHVAEDFETQARQVFSNIRTVLAEADMDFSHVTKCTNYLVSADDLPAFRTVRDELWPELFPTGTLPADTLLIVARLARPEFRIEIEAVAVRN